MCSGKDALKIAWADTQERFNRFQPFHAPPPETKVAPRPTFVAHWLPPGARATPTRVTVAAQSINAAEATRFGTSAETLDPDRAQAEEALRSRAMPASDR
jgi:hypothetical protein